MKRIIPLFSLVALIPISSVHASEEVLQACIRVVEVEGQPEGIAGCQCLAETVGDDQALIDELIDQAEKEPEERMLSQNALNVVGQCFALPDDSEDA